MGVHSGLDALAAIPLPGWLENKDPQICHTIELASIVC
jgi:hypothetical protein